MPVHFLSLYTTIQKYKNAKFNLKYLKIIIIISIIFFSYLNQSSWFIIQLKMIFRDDFEMKHRDVQSANDKCLIIHKTLAEKKYVLIEKRIQSCAERLMYASSLQIMPVTQAIPRNKPCLSIFITLFFKYLSLIRCLIVTIFIADADAINI